MISLKNNIDNISKY